MTPNSHIVYLGLGTNLGSRSENLRSALAAMPPRVAVIDQSPVYQTPPWGFTDQADFLNQVVKAETALTPRRLLRYLKRIEKQVGRTATFRWGPREIDIDILFYDSLQIHTKRLTIPHPRVIERAFMLVPLADLAPDLTHPGTGLTIQEHLLQLETEGIKAYHPPSRSKP